MKAAKIAALAAYVALCAGAADARALKLKLAKPQPSGLSAGLSVEYAYPNDVKTLRDAYVSLGMGGEPGKPLTGLSYDGPLTATRETRVAARITGYVKFDEAGTYSLNFLTNDGVQVTLGGQEVAKFDERTPCGPTKTVEVRVPKAGWYELEALWFQRKASSCLHMQLGPEDGEPTAVPDSIFGH